MDGAGWASISWSMQEHNPPDNAIERIPQLLDAVMATDPLDDLSEKLVQEISAIKMMPQTGLLSPAGRQRYRRNCEIIRMVEKGLTARNLAILQVYEEEQWREEFPTVAEFARTYAGLSKPQLFKVIDEARVHYVFAAAGLRAVRPSGRCREELVKVAASHWIAAWQFALDACRDDGLSASLVRDALRDYCRDHRIPFGRRQPNATSFQLTASRHQEEAGEEQDGDWKTKLTPGMKTVIRRVVSPEVVDRIEASFATKAAENVILDSLLALRPSKLDTEDALPWKELFQTIQREEPRVYPNLVLLALERCRDVLDESVLARCQKNVEAKAFHRRKKGQTINNPTS